jgi:hypothetical protein
MPKEKFTYDLKPVGNSFKVTKRLDGEPVIAYQVSVNDVGYAYLCSCPTYPRNYPCKHMRMVSDTLRERRDETCDQSKEKESDNG